MKSILASNVLIAFQVEFSLFPRFASSSGWRCLRWLIFFAGYETETACTKYASSPIIVWLHVNPCFSKTALAIRLLL